jgi:hypothetical protein
MEKRVTRTWNNDISSTAQQIGIRMGLNIRRDAMKAILNIRGRLYRVLPVMVLIVLVSACARLNTIQRNKSLPADTPHVVSIDAKQRVILSNPGQSRTGEDKNPAIVRFCAEPPPDVFTALASSLGAEASVSQSTTTDVAARLAATISENAATIERTQTINILREAMYRNCERYLSGAISEDEFIVQASRDQQLIIQVLAVEQITGVAKSQSTALTTVVKSAAGGVSNASLAVLADAKKDLDAKRADLAEAVEAAETLAPSGPCGDTPLDEGSPPSGVTAEQAKAKNAKCAEAAEAAERVKAADEYFTLVKEAVARLGSVDSETRGQLATAALTVSEASSEIAKQVVEIVRQYQAFDEIGMSCVVKMRTTSELPEFCKKLLEQMAKTRTVQLGIAEDQLNAVRVKAFLSEMDAATQSAAQIVWEKLGRQADPAKLRALSEKAEVNLSAAHLGRLEAAKNDFGVFLRAFERLPPDQQEALARAATQP